MTKRVLSIIMIVTALAGLTVTRTALISASAVPETSSVAGSAIINEIKSGNGSGTGTTTPAEYVTIYNATDTELILDGWKLEFAKQRFPSLSCDAPDWKTASAINVNSVTLSGNLASRTVSAPFAIAINNDMAGAVQLVDSNAIKQDLVGWNIGAVAAPCKEQTTAPDLRAGKSLQRYLGCISNLPIDTDDNGADFVVSGTPSPGMHGTTIAPQCTPAVEEPDEAEAVPTPIPDTGEQLPDTDGEITPDLPPDTPEVQVPDPAPDPVPAISCSGIVISEILPNPAGTDTGHEFIELYNPTSETVAVSSCRLQTSASTSKSYDLGETGLQPGEYRVLTDAQTGLSLPNASGGTVWLLSADDTEVSEATYPGDLPDDVGWAIADGTWGKTYTPTPNAPNVITPTEPCPAGQTRNIDTNRCNTITDVADAVGNTGTTSASATAAAVGPAPCKPGQERNPDTNRCRNIASATSASTPTPCKVGQERNPDTNRCRNIATASTAKTAAACPAGQERNPDTNRCRKITASAASKGGDGVEDTAAAAPAKKKPYGLIAAVILAAAICYAIYEWRQEIVSRLKSVSERFRKGEGSNGLKLAYTRTRA